MKSNSPLLSLLLLVLSVVLLIIVRCVQPDEIDSNKASDDKTLNDKSDRQIDKNFLLHEDTAYKVKIFYPKAWKLVETKDNIFAFQEPKLDADDNIQENINLIMNDVSGQNLKFDKFKDIAMENLKQTVQEFSLVESSSTTLAGSPAQKTVFTAFEPKLKLLQVITLKDDITYAITFVSEPESFDNYLGTIQKMLDSFEITGDLKEQDKKESANKDLEKPEEKKQDSEIKSVAKDLIDKNSLAGTYRCWSYNVQGVGKSCTSPPIVLKQDGTYSMSKEQGTYTVNGDIILLSESKLRGPGKLLEDGNQIRFEYDYNNWHHTITYLKTDWESAEDINKAATASGADGTSPKYVEVSLNIVFPESQGVSGINSVSLTAKGEKELTGEAIAYESKPHTVTALFRKLATKPGILTGKIYTVQVSSGFGYWEVGEIDLRDVKEDVELTLNAKSDTGSTSSNVDSTTNSNTNDGQQTSQLASEQQPSSEQPVTEPTATPPTSEQTQPTDTQQTQPAANAPKCDPNIPKYSQPGCVE